MERSIYADVLRQLSVYYPQLMATASAMAHVDVLLSFAEVAAHQGYVRPVLQQESSIEISGGRHPGVEYKLDGGVFLPQYKQPQADTEHRAPCPLLTRPNNV